MHAGAHAIVLTYAHALDLTRAAAITTTCSAAPDLIRALTDLTRPRALADALAGDLTGALELARVRAVELAAAIDEDLSILGAFDFDVEHPRELGRVHAADLDRADVLARTIAHEPDPELARVLGTAGVGATPARPCRCQGSSGSRCAGSPTARSPAPCSRFWPCPVPRAPDPYQAFAIIALTSKYGDPPEASSSRRRSAPRSPTPSAS